MNKENKEKRRRERDAVEIFPNGGKKIASTWRDLQRSGLYSFPLSSLTFSIFFIFFHFFVILVPTRLYREVFSPFSVYGRPFRPGMQTFDITFLNRVTVVSPGDKALVITASRFLGRNFSLLESKSNEDVLRRSSSRTFRSRTF